MGWRSWLGRWGRVDSAEHLQRGPAPAPAALGVGFALLDDAHGEDACVGCGLCAALCPVGAIRVEPGPLAPSPRTGAPRGHALDFTLDPRLCVACELCMQVCPTDALRLFPDAGAAADRVLTRPTLRAAAAGARGSRRRLPLGPPPAGPAQPLAPQPATGAPGPLRRPAPARGLYAVDGPPREPAALSAHPVETPTGEPTRLEVAPHREDAPTDPDTEGLLAGGDPGEWEPTGGSHAAEERTARHAEDRSEEVDPSELIAVGDWLETDLPPPARPAGGRRTRREEATDRLAQGELPDADED